MSKNIKYVVEGALVKCNQSVSAVKIKLKATSNSRIGNKLRIMETDTTPASFDGNFGYCKRHNGMPCMIATIPKWINTNANFVTGTGIPCVTMDSFLVCKYGGGAIIPVTDGQELTVRDNYNLPDNWYYFDKIVIPNTNVGGRFYAGTDGMLSKELQSQIGDLCKQLNIDYYLVIGTIAHESRCNPDPKPASANGLMQITTSTWNYYTVDKQGYYFNDYKSQRDWAVQHGANFDNKLDPLANVTVGICRYRQGIIELERKKPETKGDMFAAVASYGEGAKAASTTEILYYRDTLAKQAGKETWYEGTLYEID